MEKVGEGKRVKEVKKEVKIEKKGQALGEIKSEFIEILKSDPCLPKELLPENWFGEKVKEYFKE